MFARSTKFTLAAFIIFAGAALTSAGAANAGSSVSFYVGNGNSGIHFHSAPRRHGPVFHQHRHLGRAICSPRQAIGKAANLGVRNAHIYRLSDRRVYVRGWNRGRPAYVTFQRYSRKCKILRSSNVRPAYRYR